MFLISVYFMWIYDYFMTLGDEVWPPCIFRSKFQVLTVVQIKYFWLSRKSWGKFTSGSREYLMTHAVT